MLKSPQTTIRKLTHINKWARIKPKQEIPKRVCFCIAVMFLFIGIEYENVGVRYVILK